MLSNKIIKLNLNIFRYNSNGATSKIVNPMKHYDQTQLNLLNEPCILVNEKDEIVGEAIKKDCHLIDKMKSDKYGMLHRAFSVFLFDSNKRILLQQRSLYKITFPNHWTNACCSHPLNIPLEKESNNDIGIRRAARRRVAYELGIPEAKIDLDDFKYLTRIQYKADNIPYDGIFAENEIDYVLFLIGDYPIKFNTNEIKAVRYFDHYELKEFIDEEKSKTSGVLLTPWFKLICENFLFKWWSNLDKLDSLKDHKTIFKL